MTTTASRTFAKVSTSLPGPKSRAISAREEPYLAPGIQQISQLAGLALEGGQGAVVVDADGNRFLDFNAGIGVASIGHGHPALAEALATQARKITSGSYASEARASLLERIAQQTGKIGSGRADPHDALLGRRRSGRIGAAPGARAHQEARSHRLLGRLSRQDHRRARAHGLGLQARPRPAATGQLSVAVGRSRDARAHHQAVDDGQAGRDHRRADPGHRRQHHAAARLPRRCAQARARARRALHRRRDDHRLGPHRPHVRAGALRRRSRHHDLRQGRRRRLPRRRHRHARRHPRRRRSLVAPVVLLVVVRRLAARRRRGDAVTRVIVDERLEQTRGARRRGPARRVAALAQVPVRRRGARPGPAVRRRSRRSQDARAAGQARLRRALPRLPRARPSDDGLRAARAHQPAARHHAKPRRTKASTSSKRPWPRSPRDAHDRKRDAPDGAHAVARDDRLVRRHRDARLAFCGCWSIRCTCRAGSRSGPCSSTATR